MIKSRAIEGMQYTFSRARHLLIIVITSEFTPPHKTNVFGECLTLIGCKLLLTKDFLLPCLYIIANT